MIDALWRRQPADGDDGGRGGMGGRTGAVSDEVLEKSTGAVSHVQRGVGEGAADAASCAEASPPWPRDYIVKRTRGVSMRQLCCRSSF